MAFRLILGNAYITYENAQNILQMETLLERRETLFTNFTLKSINIKQMKFIYTLKQKEHHMETRSKNETYQVGKTNTEILKQSAGIQIQITANIIKDQISYSL